MVHKDLTDYGFKYPIPATRSFFLCNPYEFTNGGYKMGDKESNKKKDWKKVEDTIFKFEKEGDSVEGILQSVEEGKNYGNKVYKLKGDNDVTHVVFSTTVMESQMMAVKIGDAVKIKFVGEKENEKKGQNPIKIFEIFTL